MNKRTKLGLNILEAALLLGVLGDALLRETPWGLNVFLWTSALAAAMYALHARSGVRASWRADGGWLLVPVVFFAASFAWRDSATLKLLDGLALFVSLALLAWRARGRRIRLGGLADYALGLGHAAFDALFASLPLVISDVRWGTIPRRGAMRHAWAAARGLVIAVPLLFVFGALFMAADAVFEGFMRQTFQIDLGVLFSHFFLMLLFTWMTGGFLRGMVLAEEASVAEGAVAEASAPPAVPVAYTSITADDAGRHGATAGVGAKHEDDAHAHRQPPRSVVVEGGATANDRSEGDVDISGDGDHAKFVDGDKPVAGVGEKTGAGDEKPEAGGGNSEAGSGNSEASSENSEASGENSEARGERLGGTEEERASDASPVATAREASAQGLSLGAVEVGVVLGLLNVLFACFVLVQFRYFFGGAARVMSITELTYAEYARRGFFELTWVAALVLPLLLGAHALLRKNSPAAGRIFRPLAGAQVALLFVIMASAVARMRLYQSEYGLTELRFYTMAFMLWLGLVFVWFAWTVLVRSRRERFACGALVAAFVTVGLLHLVNPDAYIVRANAAHARTGRSFDAGYAASLSADAIPALISALPALSRDERCYLELSLKQKREHNVFGEDWRAWSFARWRARHALAAHRGAPSEAGCTPPPAVNAHVQMPAAAPEPPPLPAPPTPAQGSAATTTTGAAATTSAANATTTNGATTNRATTMNAATTNAAIGIATTNAPTNAATRHMSSETKKATPDAARRARRSAQRRKN
ncbi:MAG TPA: DUF4153 domain-containing protein [Pyrinomonadaceae bacterium]|nr:DUF4153 domain-containing protein [Pyrinomonadaceae bacterium]